MYHVMITGNSVASGLRNKEPSNASIVAKNERHVERERWGFHLA